MIRGIKFLKVEIFYQSIILLFENRRPVVHHLLDLLTDSKTKTRWHIHTTTIPTLHIPAVNCPSGCIYEHTRASPSFIYSNRKNKKNMNHSPMLRRFLFVYTFSLLTLSLSGIAAAAAELNSDMLEGRNPSFAAGERVSRGAFAIGAKIRRGLLAQAKRRKNRRTETYELLCAAKVQGPHRIDTSPVEPPGELKYNLNLVSPLLPPLHPSPLLYSTTPSHMSMLALV